MFNIVMQIDKKYFLGAIDTTTNTYVTSEDICCFQTVEKLVRDKIGLFNKPEIVYRLTDRAYTLTNIVGLNADSSEPRLIVDMAFLNFGGVENYISESILEAISCTDGFELTEELKDTVLNFERDIEARSNHWGEFKEPKYPLDNTLFSDISLSSSFEVKTDSIIATGVREDVVTVTNPYQLISIPIADAQSIIRAYSEKFNTEDFMLKDIQVGTTNEFGDSDADDDDDDDDDDDTYRIPTQGLIPNFNTLINFKYYVPELITDQSLLSIAKDAIDSIYYKSNLRVLNPLIRADNECFTYVIGKESVSEELNPNERYMHLALSTLLVDLLMYEYKIYNIYDLEKLGHIRSVLFDSYMLDMIRNLLPANYAYTGKAVLTVFTGSEGDDSTDDGSAALFGYKRTFCEGGSYYNTLSEDDWIKIKDKLNPDGIQRVKNYLNSIVNSSAYKDMFMFLLRFGQTKNRYLKVHSEESVTRPYFDTLTFDTVQQPNIEAKYEYVKTPSGKDYYLDGEVYLSREFTQLEDNPVSLPIAVVLRRELTNSINKKNEYIVIDLVAFCSVALTPISGSLAYAIEGIDLVGELPVINAEYLRESGSKVYRVEDILDKLKSEDENCILGLNTRITRLLHKYKTEASVNPNETLNVYEAYKQIEDHKYSYEDINVDFDPASCSTAKEYVYRKIMKDLLSQMINQTVAAKLRKVSIVDLLVEKQRNIENESNGNTVDNLTFVNLLPSRTASYKIINKKISEDVLGYVFKCKYEDKSYMLISSTEDIGLNLPTDSNWYVFEYSVLHDKILKPYSNVSDKASYVSSKAAMGMYFASDKTLDLLLSK